MMSSDHEAYPMPLFPRLTVADVDCSVEWYEDVGFETVFAMPGMAHVRYRKYADVMLVAADTPTRDPAGVGVAIYLTLEGESVEAVAERAETAGNDADDADDADGEVAAPEETAWNTRELTLRDPDGYELVFSAVVDADRSFEDVMGADFDDR